jgi:hypothetical protein
VARRKSPGYPLNIQLDTCIPGLVRVQWKKSIPLLGTEREDCGIVTIITEISPFQLELWSRSRKEFLVELESVKMCRLRPV